MSTLLRAGGECCINTQKGRDCVYSLSRHDCPIYVFLASWSHYFLPRCSALVAIIIIASWTALYGPQSTSPQGIVFVSYIHAYTRTYRLGRSSFFCVPWLALWFRWLGFHIQCTNFTRLNES